MGRHHHVSVAVRKLLLLCDVCTHHSYPITVCWAGAQCPRASSAVFHGVVGGRWLRLALFHGVVGGRWLRLALLTAYCPGCVCEGQGSLLWLVWGVFGDRRGDSAISNIGQSGSVPLGAEPHDSGGVADGSHTSDQSCLVQPGDSWVRGRSGAVGMVICDVIPTPSCTLV